MNFLAMLIAVILDRSTGVPSAVHRDGWFLRWQEMLSGFGVGGWLRVVIVLLLPILGVSWLLQLFAGILFGLPWIALAVLVLLYSFGRIDLGRLQAEYRDHCRREDFQGALLGVQSALPDLDIGQDADAAHRSVQRELLYQAYQRWFGVLFYFLLFGPLGALGYRLCHLLLAESQRDQLLFWVDWVPARALAATFCLAGDFTGSVDNWLAALREPSAEAPDVLQSVGFAAVSDTSPTEEMTGEWAALHNGDMEALVHRSAVCWIAVIAFLVILG